MNAPVTIAKSSARLARSGPVPLILAAVSVSHLLNDLLQSLLPSIYPILKGSFGLTFAEIGLIQLAFQLTASILQPLVGTFTDRHPRPFSASMGMIASMAGLLLLAYAGNLAMLLLAAAVVGIGSAIFHPEAARIARAASGGRYGMAQSLFQVGGNFGSAIGPLLAAAIILPFGQSSISWFVIVPLVAMAVLFQVGRWYRDHLEVQKSILRMQDVAAQISRPEIIRAIVVLLALIFSKFFYMACMSTFFTFYLIDKFGVSVRDAQIDLFIFLGAVALGTFLGGPLGDAYGRRKVIWVSILGVLPMTLLLPHVSLAWSLVLSVGIGLVLSSAFSAIVVYAQELLPGRVGMISGLFFGFAFGMGGLGAALLGVLADHTSVDFVFQVCAFLPAIGLLTWFLPRTGKDARA